MKSLASLISKFFSKVLKKSLEPYFLLLLPFKVKRVRVTVPPILRRNNDGQHWHDFHERIETWPRAFRECITLLINHGIFIFCYLHDIFVCLTSTSSIKPIFINDCVDIKIGHCCIHLQLLNNYLIMFYVVKLTI